MTPIASHTEQLLTGLLKRSLQQEVDNGLQQEQNTRNASASTDQTMKDSEQNHFPIQDGTEVQKGEANQVPVQKLPRFSQADRLAPISGDQIRRANGLPFPLAHAWGNGGHQRI